MSKGKKQFGDSPQEILLKRKLGMVEYTKRKNSWRSKIETPMTPLQKSTDDVIKAFGGKGFTTDIDDGWVKAKGHYFWRGGKGFYSEAGSWDTEELKKLIDKTKLTTYTDEEGNSQTEKNADTTESWANKWAEENGL